jgi:hypothetical protein
MAATLTGCAVAGWVAHAVHDPAKEESPPEYQGLLNKSIAVVVAADDTALGAYPNAPLRIGQYVTQRLATEVTGVRAMAPAEVARYQRANPDWIATPYGEVARELKVDRLVVISLAEYRTHEFGNREVWQGILSARVGVIEADANDPSNFKYLKNVAVQFPPDKPMGVLDANEEKIQHGMLSLFAGKVAALFRELPRP